MAKGKGHAQQLRAIDKQVIHEQEKHKSRQARLRRIRELAVEKGNTKTVERADKLMQKEQTRFERKHKQMRTRQENAKKLTQVKRSDGDKEKAVKKTNVDGKKGKKQNE